MTSHACLCDVWFTKLNDDLRIPLSFLIKGTSVLFLLIMMSSWSLLALLLQGGKPINYKHSDLSNPPAVMWVA